MKKIMDNDYFTKRMYFRVFAPSLLSAIGLAFGNVADALFVGIDIGESALAAMALVAPVYMIYNVLELGISLGVSVKYTKLLGEGKPKEGAEVFTQMSIMTLVVSAALGGLCLLFMPQVLFVLGAGKSGIMVYELTRQYLEIMFLAAPINFAYFTIYFCVKADDGVRVGSAGYTVGYLFDIILSYVFVMLMGFGIRGAIIATVVGKIIGILIFMLHFLNKNRHLKFVKVKPDIREMLRVFKNGFSVSSTYIFQFVVLIVINNTLMVMSGDTGVAIFNLIQNISYVIIAVFDAVGNTVQPVAGTLASEHNLVGVKTTVKLAAITASIAGFAVSAAIYILARPISIAFGMGNVADECVIALRIFCPAGFISGFSIVATYYYQVMGKEKLVIFINMLRSFIVYIVFAIVLIPVGMPLYWWIFILTESLSLVIWVARLNYHKKNERKEQTDHILSKTICDKAQDMAKLIEDVQDFCEIHEASMKQTFYVTMCVEEIAQAIIENAFTGDGSDFMQITLIFFPNKEFELHIRDSAVNFNPFELKTYINLLKSDEDLSGLGILMVKKKAKAFFYRRYSGFNTLAVRI